jgi:hypothetical protein
MEIQASVDFINKFKQNSNTNAVTKDYSTLSKDNEQSSDEKSLDEIINELESNNLDIEYWKEVKNIILKL